MKRLILSLLLVTLLAGCITTRTNCPEFPLPSAHVQSVMDKMSLEDKEIWEWGNKLLDLCQKLNTCE